MKNVEKYVEKRADTADSGNVVLRTVNGKTGRVREISRTFRRAALGAFACFVLFCVSVGLTLNGFYEKGIVISRRVTGCDVKVTAAAEQTSNDFDGAFDDFSGMKGEFGGTENAENREFIFSAAEKGILAAIGVAVIAVSVVLWRKNRKEKKRMEEMQKKIEKVLKFTEKDELLYVDVADMLKNGKNRFLYAEEDGVLFQDDRGFYEKGTYVFAAENDAVTRKILLSLPFEERNNVSQGVLACHGSEIAEICKEFFGYDRVTPCYQVVYGCESRREPKGIVRFEKVSEKYLPLVIRTYDRESPDALKRLAEQGKIEAAFAEIDGKEQFVGYIGQHPEGSMGMLYVFPEFRRRGFAEELESREINAVLDEGRVPYAHIIEDNYKSFALQQKLGAKVAADKVVWMSNSARKKDR